MHNSWSSLPIAVLLTLLLGEGQAHILSTPLSFIENRGQWAPEVLYLWSQAGLNAWITRSGVVYDFYALRPREINHLSSPHSLTRRPHHEYERYGHVIRVSHVGASPSLSPEGAAQLPTYYNYFLGNNPSRWAVLVPLYQEVLIHDIYPCISLRWYAEQGRLRHDYVVAPGADPGQIKLHIEGATTIHAEGNKLLLGTRFGYVEIAGLQVYQTIQGRRVFIPASWVVEKGVIRFQIASYDKRYPLVIDPYVWSRYIGGVNADEARALALDSQRNLVVAGTTSSPTFPTTPGAYDGTLNGEDAFFAKLNPNTGAILYATFVGGGGTNQAADVANDVAVGRGDTIYLTGYTTALDFPTTSGSYRPTKPSSAGDREVFIACFNAAGTQLLYGTYIGGNNSDGGEALAVSPQGEIFVTGITWSSNFPRTSGVVDNTLTGTSWDAFVLKLRPANNGMGDLIYSTFLGGSSSDEGVTIAVDAAGRAYVGGSTSSSDFPLGTVGYSGTYGSGGSGFFVRLNPSATAIDYGTFIGGNNTTNVQGLSLDQFGFVYLAGSTAATDFPTTLGSYDGTLGTAIRNAFIMKLNPDPSIPRASQLVFSTLLGLTGEIYGEDIALDTARNCYITGRVRGGNASLPLTSDAFDQTYQGNEEAFVAKINARGTQLLYSTYIGGSSEDRGEAILVDTTNGAVYVCGWTKSADFPVGSGSSLGGNNDAFVMRISIPTAPTTVSAAFDERGWRAFPTQTTGEIWIDNRLGRTALFEVWDVSGRCVERFTAPEGLHAFFLQQAPGLYILYETKSQHSEKLLLTP
ncbi:MAG: SBBP repeat-containing protein [Bacteroidia bacterium]|nr:SBBP repeat-containing protein [Bacteroidia bacterium]